MTLEGAMQRAQSPLEMDDVSHLIGGAEIVFDQHSLVWVRGSDAVSFLDGLLSQSVAASQPEAVRRSFLLTPQGKLRALLWILGNGDDEVGLVTQRSTEAIVVEDLTRFKFRVDAAIEVEIGPIVTLLGDGAAAALTGAGLPSPEAGWLKTPLGLVAKVPFTSGEIQRYVLVGEAVAAVAAGVGVMSGPAYESIRIGLGEPQGNVDFTDQTISHELGPVDSAVDFAKGCYLGQELVARIDSRGRVTRRLRGVSVSDRIDLDGAVLTVADRTIGTVTSSAMAPDGMGTLGLALVHHEITDGSLAVATVQGEPYEARINGLPQWPRGRL